jgi:hypothetical protein
LDHSEHQHAQKTEPSFEPGTAAAPGMPDWRHQPAAAPSAAQRWGRRIVFLGVALLAMAAAGGLTLLGLDLYETHGSMEVVAANAPAQPPSGPLTLPERRGASLPPLVLLPQDAKAALKKDAPPAVAAVPAPLIVVPPAPAPLPVKAPVKPKPVKLAAQPVVKEKPAKPAAQPVVKPKPVKLAAQPVAKPVAVIKKPVAAVKRTPASLPAKAAAHAKPVKAAPARNLGRDPAFDDPPPAAAERSCRPGELARECEARTR